MSDQQTKCHVAVCVLVNEAGPRQGVEMLFVVDSIAQRMRRKLTRYMSCGTDTASCTYGPHDSVD
jgi:hypothetical protein